MKKIRITNIDTLSALFDRLITENIKLFFFEKEGKIDNSNHQKTVIKEIKQRISELVEECVTQREYNYLSEERTFNIDSVVEELEELIFNDINIGESDRARLAEANSPDPNLRKFTVNEKRLRKANEGRSKSKNNIDKAFKKMVEK